MWWARPIADDLVAVGRARGPSSLFACSSLFASCGVVWCRERPPPRGPKTRGCCSIDELLMISMAHASHICSTERASDCVRARANVAMPQTPQGSARKTAGRCNRSASECAPTRSCRHGEQMTSTKPAHGTNRAGRPGRRASAERPEKRGPFANRAEHSRCCREPSRRSRADRKTRFRFRPYSSTALSSAREGPPRALGAPISTGPDGDPAAAGSAQESSFSARHALSPRPATLAGHTRQHSTARERQACPWRQRAPSPNRDGHPSSRRFGRRSVRSQTASHQKLVLTSLALEPRQPSPVPGAGEEGGADRALPKSQHSLWPQDLGRPARVQRLQRRLTRWCRPASSPNGHIHRVGEPVIGIQFERARG